MCFYLLRARSGNIHDSGRLLQLEVSDKSLAEIIGLLQNIHGISATRQSQQDTMLLLHLHFTGNAFQLLLFQPHPLGYAKRQGQTIGAARQRPSCDHGIARDEVHLDNGMIVFEGH